MCNKVPLLTQTKANEVAKLMEVKYHDLFAGYWCSDCQAYHVAHRVSKKLRNHFKQKFVREVEK